jgi:Mg2+-importing ATPase
MPVPTQHTEAKAPELAQANVGPGLTSGEARQRLVEVGPNELAPARRLSALGQIVALVANPLVVILLLASVVSAVLGQYVDAVIIVVMVVLSIALNAFQTLHSERATNRLRQQVAPTANVLRDGSWSQIPRHDVVPGDCIAISAGDLVPADARLLEATDLHVNEAALTGESLPVEKKVGAPGAAPPSAGDTGATVFLGTAVVSGMGTAEVTATGPRTSFGDIAARLAARPPDTDFERGTRQFGYLIMKTVVFLVLFVLFVSILLHRNTLESLLFALALAVGLTPEFLPMITTVTLGKGAVHMARKKVIVRRLAAIQNFGSMDVLCSDKTGTLTTGETALERAVDPACSPSDRVFLLAYLNSVFETGIKNPLDLAVVAHAKPDVEGYRKIGEIPFDFERRRLSIVVERAGERTLITKGAPESVLACCSRHELGGKPVPFDPEAQKQSTATHQGLAALGYRVLAIAYGIVPDQATVRASDEGDLVLAGFLAFSDPPREDAAAVLESLASDGVQIKILTGDSEIVTAHVCSQVGLDPGRIILGEEIDRASDQALLHLADANSVFARVSPAQKHRIILSLKKRGHVVGFLGDGINDAPSLHAADVGISVSSAVDVAKDAAEIILLERSLGTLHQGIIEGRKAFGNVMKYLLMGTSSNFGNMFSMAASSLFLPFLPMLPTQILLNNFLYDLAQVTIPTDNVDTTYLRKPRHWNIKLIRDFMLYIGPISSIYDFLTFFALLKVFHATESLFHTGWFVESLATQTLVLFVIRTAGNPFRSRPSLALTISTIAIVVAAVLLPYTPFSTVLGFEPLPAPFYAFLVVATGTYLLLVQLVKRRLMARI